MSEVTNLVGGAASGGFLARMQESCFGLVAGPVLVFGTIGLLFWNEGRAVSRYKALVEAKEIFQPVTNISFVDSSLEDELIHLTGTTKSFDEHGDPYLHDDLFGLVENGGIRLNRIVETYQYVETKIKKKAGKDKDGNQLYEDDFKYDDKWAQGLQNSNNFDDTSYDNPSSPLFVNDDIQATKVFLGAYTISDFSKLTFPTQAITDLSDYNLTLPTASNGATGKVSGKYIYYRKNANAAGDKIGDTRVSFSSAVDTEVSIMAQNDEGNLVRYEINENEDIYLIEKGNVDGVTMIQHDQDANKAMTWILRAAGFGAMMLGFMLCFDPCTTAVDFIPILGDILEFGMNILACLLAFIISFVVIAIAWVWYRPVVGICLLAAVVVVIVLAFVFKPKRSRAVGVAGDATESYQNPDGKIV